jgi:hypothetical protein
MYIEIGKRFVGYIEMYYHGNRVNTCITVSKGMEINSCIDCITEFIFKM